MKQSWILPEEFDVILLDWIDWENWICFIYFMQTYCIDKEKANQSACFWSKYRAKCWLYHVIKSVFGITYIGSFITWCCSNIFICWLTSVIKMKIFLFYFWIAEISTLKHNSTLINLELMRSQCKKENLPMTIHDDDIGFDADGPEFLSSKYWCNFLICLVSGKI